VIFADNKTGLENRVLHARFSRYLPCRGCFANEQCPDDLRRRAGRPGDVIVADVDGVCVVKKEKAAEVDSLAVKKFESEAAGRSRFAKGELSTDVDGNRPTRPTWYRIYREGRGLF
jgi:4-hydroxy-4-methyl-2-oxoglutarate aldolase